MTILTTLFVQFVNLVHTRKTSYMFRLPFVAISREVLQRMIRYKNLTTNVQI